MPGPQPGIAYLGCCGEVTAGDAVRPTESRIHYNLGYFLGPASEENRPSAATLTADFNLLYNLATTTEVPLQIGPNDSFESSTNKQWDDPVSVAGDFPPFTRFQCAETAPLNSFRSNAWANIGFTGWFSRSGSNATLNIYATKVLLRSDDPAFFCWREYTELLTQGEAFVQVPARCQDSEFPASQFTQPPIVDALSVVANTFEVQPPNYNPTWPGLLSTHPLNPGTGRAAKARFATGFGCGS